MNVRGPKVDRMGELAEKIAKVKDAMVEYEKLRKEIVAWFADAPADQEFTESGKRFTLTVGERGKERVVNLAKLVKKLGPKKFLSVVTVPMKLLDQHVSPEDQKDLVTEERTGARRVTVERKKEAA